MPLPPSTIHASTRARLEHQAQMMERQLYVHPPEFEAEYDRLMKIDETRRDPPRPYHDDWKSR